MSVSSLLNYWQAEPTIADNITTWHILPARQAQFLPIPKELHPDLDNTLSYQGIQELYTHQALSWGYVTQGKNIVIATGTASGKTLCYNLPVLDHLLKNPEARALYLFPTKALAQDQAEAIRKLLSTTETERNTIHKSSAKDIGAIYDGDTPPHARSYIRKHARLVLSNPDMLHIGILPYHTKWVEFFANLHYVVIDEMHIYRGVFGSHVANVIRRLKRISQFYGANPQFILTSATIANPIELAERLIETPVTLVNEDGSARGAQHFLLYNPPIIDPELQLRQSILQEALHLASDLLTYNLQTIIFGRSRRTVEILLKYLREKFIAIADGISALEESEIRGYRSGYLSLERRQIEQGLRSGKVRAVVATNALELGIDIGGMEAALLVGYPGTIASTWQQVGRAGRSDAPSIAVLLASASPLDQFLVHHPEYFFGRSPEQALIDPDHLLILLNHLQCAAFELPFHDGESFGQVLYDEICEFLDILTQGGTLQHSNQRYYWVGGDHPATSVSLRNASPERVLLQSVDRIIGEVDKNSAPWMVYPGAIYLHEAQAYLVDSLDLEKNLAYLNTIDADFYTEPKTETEVQLLNIHRQESIPGAVKLYGEISVTTRVTGYRRVQWYTHETLGQAELNLPPNALQTAGFWLALTEDTVEKLRNEGHWSTDRNEYGPDWERQRNQARARDGYRCQVCGLPETGRAHHVHHKTPFRTFPSVVAANHLSNLITLCANCHRRVETAVRVRSGLSGLAFALGHLAPLFLMCDSNDLGVYSEPQSPLAEGAPVVVLYDQVPAGIGFSQRLYEIHHELFQRTQELIVACECLEGCPSCVGPGGENGRGGKLETLAILEVLCPPSPID